MDNQKVLVAVIFALVIVIGILAADRYRQPETLGEKVGHSIDRVTDQITDEDRRNRR